MSFHESGKLTSAAGSSGGLKTAWQLSERLACGLVNVSTSVLRYRPRPDTSRQLHERIVSLAGQRRRFGYRRIYILLKREGRHINVKRIYRLYRNAGLAVRKRSRKRIGLTERVPLLLPETANHAWSMDFVHDGLADGRRIRYLNGWMTLPGKASSSGRYLYFRRARGTYIGPHCRASPFARFGLACHTAIKIESTAALPLTCIMICRIRLTTQSI